MIGIALAVIFALALPLVIIVNNKPVPAAKAATLIYQPGIDMTVTDPRKLPFPVNLAIIRMGMSKDQIRRLLGTPTDIDPEKLCENWAYNFSWDDPCGSFGSDTLCRSGSYVIQFENGVVYSAWRMDKKLDPPSLDWSSTWWR